MRLWAVFILIFLQGCAAITCRNYIDLNVAKKASVTESDVLVYGDSEFEVKVYNRNSNLSYLTVGPVIPIVPFSLFSRQITPNGHFTIEFVLSSKAGANADAVLDFSALTLEEPLTKSEPFAGSTPPVKLRSRKFLTLTF